jgi:hypothetical protein
VGNNFRTKIECRKMRMNEPEPQPVIVETPQDRIEFYVVKSGYRTEEPLWPTMAIAVETAETATEIGDTPPSGEIESLRNVYAMLGAGMTRMERGQLLLQIQELERGEAEAG